MNTQVTPFLDQETLEKYSVKDTADFDRAWELSRLLSEGHSREDAVQRIGLSLRTSYTDRWKKMLATAQVIRQEIAIQDLKSITQRVHDSWSDIVGNMIRIAQSGPPREAVQAFIALQEHYVTPYMDKDEDTSEASAFLNRKPNFNPQKSVLDMVRSGVKVTLEPSAPEPLTIDG